MFENTHYYEMQASVYRELMQAEAEQARRCALLACPKRVIGYLFLAQVGVFFVRFGLAIERIAQVKTQRAREQVLDRAEMVTRLP